MQQPQKSSSVSSFSPVIANGTNNNNHHHYGHNGNMASTSTSSASSTFPVRGQPNSSPGTGHGHSHLSQQLLFGSSSGSALAGGYTSTGSGLWHSSSSSILSQNSLAVAGNSSNNNADDKAYTQNALKLIRNSLQPFATKHNGSGGSNGLDRRPSSASSNASSSNSVPVAAAGTTNHSFGQLLLQQASSAAAAAANNNSNSSSNNNNNNNNVSFLYQLNPAQLPPASHGSYQYGQVNKLATSASSTQISLLNHPPMPMNTHSFSTTFQNHHHHNHNSSSILTNGGALRASCDNNNNSSSSSSHANGQVQTASPRFDEHQRKLIKTLIELGLPEVNFSFVLHIS